MGKVWNSGGNMELFRQDRYKIVIHDIYTILPIDLENGEGYDHTVERNKGDIQSYSTYKCIILLSHNDNEW